MYAASQHAQHGAVAGCCRAPRWRGAAEAAAGTGGGCRIGAAVRRARGGALAGECREAARPPTRRRESRARRGYTGRAATVRQRGLRGGCSGGRRTGPAAVCLITACTTTQRVRVYNGIDYRQRGVTVLVCWCAYQGSSARCRMCRMCMCGTVWLLARHTVAVCGAVVSMNAVSEWRF